MNLHQNHRCIPMFVTPRLNVSVDDRKNTSCTDIKADVCCRINLVVPNVHRATAPAAHEKGSRVLTCRSRIVGRSTACRLPTRLAFPIQNMVIMITATVTPQKGSPSLCQIYFVEDSLKTRHMPSFDFAADMLSTEQPQMNNIHEGRVLMPTFVKNNCRSESAMLGSPAHFCQL